MPRKGSSQIRRRARFDVRMFASALLAASVVIALSLHYKISERREAAHTAALDLARQLVVMPVGSASVDELAPGVQRVLDYQLHNSSFAYAGIYAADGTVIAQSAATEVAPDSSVPPLTASWIQNDTGATHDSRKLSVFVGPMLMGGTQGYYRIAFFEPGWGLAIAREEIGFLAVVTLPVFLLALLGMGFMRQAIGPLRGLNKKLREQLGQQDNAIPVLAPGADMAMFASQFDQFIEQAQSRIDTYQKERDSMATSERFLHYRLNRFEAILHALPDGVAVLDDSKRITFANDRAARYLGMATDELTGKALSAGVADNRVRTWASQFEAGSGGFLPEPLIYQPNPASNVTLSCSAHAVQGQDGEEPSGYLLMISDATREMLAQQKRAEFVAHVSHELKSPLNTLGMCVETLKAPVDPSGEDAEFRLEATNIIGDEVERLAALIGNLLSITQIEMGAMEPQRTRVRLADLVEDVFATARRSSTDESLKFELDVPPKLPAVLIDKDLMRIALNNLVTNAIKYSNPDGVVRVVVADDPESLSISVQDTGIGIAQDELASIFNKFYRAEDETARARGGQGLGLALAQEIVQMHHGAIRVESSPGQGSTFTIDLWKSAEIVQQAI